MIPKIVFLVKTINPKNMNTKLQIEVWSDLVCPFCYIGKRKFEQALDEFPFKHEIELIWKSYQLNPEAVTDTQANLIENFASQKGIAVQQAAEMMQNVAQIAAESGIQMNFEIAKVINTLRAHQLSHFALAAGKQNLAEELLFSGYFTEGQNLDDMDYLKSIVAKLGLDVSEFEQAIVNGTYLPAVENDIYESRIIGVRGVPFFVYDRKYAISGAQDLAVFKATLEKAYTEWKAKSNGNLEIIQGASCGPEGCD